jgi:hypothetical protein
VIRAQEQIIDWRGKPKVIRYDNGLVYISGALLPGPKSTPSASGSENHKNTPVSTLKSTGAL